MEDVRIEVELLKRPAFNVVSKGTGPEVEVGDRAIILYSGTFYDYKPSSYPFNVGRGYAGRVTYSFPHDLIRIAGLHLLLQDMQLGDVYAITIPRELVFGREVVSATIEVQEIIRL